MRANLSDPGVPRLLGIDYRGKHTTTGTSWKVLPAYRVVKAEAIKLIRSNF